MSIIDRTGWTLQYVVNDISIGALYALLDITEEEKPRGILAKQNLDKDELTKMGLIMKGKK